MLSKRREDILKIIVRDYVDTAIPVASEHIVRKYPIKISSATIRNEMMGLEEEGYLSQPYHSAGRIPSDKGYQYYIESLAYDMELPTTEQYLIRHQFHQARRDFEEWGRLAAAILSHTVNNVAIITLPKSTESRFKHIELISIQEVIALLILISQEADIKKQIIPLGVETSQEKLSTIANKLNSLLSGLTSQEIQKLKINLSPVEKQIISCIKTILDEEDNQEYEEPFIDGIRRMFHQPEFSSADKMRQLVELFEGKAFLLKTILPQAIFREGIGITIGNDNKEESMRECSIVLTRYGIPGNASGIVGVLGPTRMQYERAISAVRCLSSIMNELLRDLY